MATKPKTEGKELALTEEQKNELAMYAGYEEDRGAGFEGQTSEDVSVPFIEILQSNSPECEGEDGLRPGQFINRATGEVFSGREGFAFVPCVTQHVVVEWVPREKGGGIVQTHELSAPLIQKVRAEQPLGKYTHPTNGNDLIETFYIYGIQVDEVGNGFPVVMAFSSTRIKAYKDWMYKARSIVIALPDGRKISKVPLFSHRYRVTALAAENAKGKWTTLTTKFDGETILDARLAPNSELYQMGKALCADVNEGRKQADLAGARGEGEGSGGMDRSPAKGDTGAEDAPY